MKPYKSTAEFVPSFSHDPIYLLPQTLRHRRRRDVKLKGPRWVTLTHRPGRPRPLCS
ncbi:hypothetical protein HanPI659440_Chr13g0517471 [Helianthus annuus]|nr:hypothetical protein HanPI659440_Chr13g0517471 [Helianthus annuus]